MAHIQKRGDGRWRARYRGPDHREHSRTFNRKNDAERFLASIESRKNAGEWIDPRRGRMSFSAWVETWAKSIIHLKPKTLAGYESLLNCYILPSFGNVALARIEPVDVREWVAALTERGLSPSRVRQAYQLLSAIMKSAVESEYIARTPCIGVKLPRTQSREMRFLSADQVEALAESADQFSLLVYVLAYTGIRWGEAVALRRGRCDLLRRRLHIVESMAEVSGQRFFGPTKTYQERQVGLPAFLAELLAEHLATLPDDPNALVFTSTNGQPLSNANFRNRVWLPALRDADLPHDLRIHDLRHTCASLLIAQGTHPKAIQAHLGHSSITVTLDRYGHLFPNALDDVARGLDAQRAAAYPRPGKSEKVIDITEKKAKAASDQQLRKWTQHPLMRTTLWGSDWGFRPRRSPGAMAGEPYPPDSSTVAPPSADIKTIPASTRRLSVAWTVAARGGRGAPTRSSRHSAFSTTARTLAHTEGLSCGPWPPRLRHGMAQVRLRRDGGRARSV